MYEYCNVCGILHTLQNIYTYIYNVCIHAVMSVELSKEMDFVVT